MSTSDYFISGDWGTTNFRLRIVDRNSLDVITEHKTESGIKPHYQKFLAQSQLDQFDFFSQYLLQQINQLPEEHRNHTIVLSGMSSANIGMQELPYADLPFGNTGKELVHKEVPLEGSSKVILISGAKNDKGVMRGEEIQALGLMDHLVKFGDGTLILPGTHSKHITYKQNKFTDLETYMTGEIFQLLSSQSILQNNIEETLWDETFKPAFLDGVKKGLNKELTANLFKLRVNDLLDVASKTENYFTLSGLLIGDELSYLAKGDERLFIAAPTETLILYHLALQSFSASERLVIIDQEILTKALLIGQEKILKLYES